MRHPIDIAAMFTALWLLVSMVVDILTPKELTAYMIGAAIGPAVVTTAVFYYLETPWSDFALLFSSLWLASAIIIELISPKPLSNWLVYVAFVPALLVGAILHLRNGLRRAKRGRAAA